MEIQLTEEFHQWLQGLRDHRAKAIIVRRIDRIATGNIGDIKTVGGPVRELRIAYGPGYRLYCVQRGSTVIVLLCGGDKSSQSRDIAKAKRLAQSLEDIK